MFGPEGVAELIKEFLPFLDGMRVVLRRGGAGHVVFLCSEIIC